MVTEAPVEPLYPADDIYGIVGANLKRPYDVREVNLMFFKNLAYYDSAIFYVEITIGSADWLKNIFQCKKIKTTNTEIF